MLAAQVTRAARWLRAGLGEAKAAAGARDWLRMGAGAAQLHREARRSLQGRLAGPQATCVWWARAAMSLWCLQKHSNAS